MTTHGMTSEPRQPKKRLWDDEWDECPFCHISAQEHYDSIDGHWFSCDLMRAAS